MSARDPSGLDIARRIADGEAIEFDALAADDPALARKLERLQALARSMRPDAGAGATWGHLQRLQLAGRGGFGSVYRAYDPTLDRSVALKLRHEQDGELLPSGRDFVAEARRLARVRHPNVLAVHGASYHGGRAGLWADWIDGDTLDARLQRDGPLRGDTLLRVLADLADAIAAVHRSGLVHGDITAGNVMLDASGRVVLMDFGAGFDNSDDGSHVSAGTPHYLAPEIVAGQPGTAAVDLYAFGVLAHRLATGQFPDAGVASRSLAPRALRGLVQSLLDAEPDRRPSADAARQRIQRVIDAPRRRTRRLLQLAVVIGLAGIALATTIGLQRESAQRRLAEHARDEATATADFLTEILAAPAPEAQGRDVRIVELLDSATRRAREQPDLSPATRAGLLLAIGRSQLALHRFRAADATLTDALALDTTQRPLATAQALQIGLELANARARRERHADADAILQRLATDPRWANDAQARTAIAIERAGWWYSQGRLAEAEAALAPVLDNATRLPADLRIDALVTQGQVLFDQGRLAEVEASTQQALALLKTSGERFGLREFELRVMHGNVATALGRPRDGEAIYRALAVDVAQAYGDDSPSLAGLWTNVAIALNDQARHDESLALLHEWLPKVEAIDGGESHRMLQLRSVLAVALQQSGALDAALDELDRLIPASVRFFGAGHPQTLIARFNRVEVLNDAGRNEEALRDGEILRTDMAAALGESHPFTLETDDATGFAMTRLGRAGEAEALHRRTIAGKTAALGADNPYTLLSQEYLARALAALQRRDEARTVLEPLLRERERVLGVAHPDTVATRTLLEELDR